MLSHRSSVSRRQFLTAGALGLGGLTLADLLRAEAASNAGSTGKAIINIHLDGGPPQIDMWDPKPEAPVEIRGEFAPLRTRLVGVCVSEMLPRLASIAGKLTFVRSLVGSAGAHDAFQCQSGFAAADLRQLGGRPAFGSVVSKLRGRPSDPAPPFVDLMQGRPLVRNSARPGFLGPTYGPFRPDISKMFVRQLEPAMVGELERLGAAGQSIELTLVEGMTPARLLDRTRLMAGFDQARRALDASGAVDAMDEFTRQAANILTSGRFAAALDLEREPIHMLDRYTYPLAAPDRHYTSEDGFSGRKLLLARRLVEAGVRCVSVSFSDFDTHSDNFPRMRQLLPVVDHAIHALITDLEERGMLGDVAVVAWGEFGRTPRIDLRNGGRDHWPEVGPALLVGGGLKGGQVIGATDRLGSRVTQRPVHYQDVFATLYHLLGINLANTTLTDPNGRPQHLLDRGSVMRELL